MFYFHFTTLHGVGGFQIWNTWITSHSDWLHCGSIYYFTGFEAFPITVNDGTETGRICSAVLPRLDCGNGRDSCLITSLQTIKDIIITQLQFSHSIDAIVTFLAHYQTMKPYN